MSTISQAGKWNLDFDGTYKLNTDFAAPLRAQQEGRQGSGCRQAQPCCSSMMAPPITTRRSSPPEHPFKSPDNGYNIVPAASTNSLNPEKGEDDYSATVTFSKSFYPLQSLFSEILHPALEDVEFLQQRLVDASHPEWAGPFTTLADKGWDSTAKTFSVVPNDKRWGTSPCWTRSSPLPR